jgi:hypothetical protein
MRRALARLGMQVQGHYLVLERDEWEAAGAGYRGKMLGS